MSRRIKRSLRTQWASMGGYLDMPQLRQQAADAVFKGIVDETLRLPPFTSIPLAAASDAHRIMASLDFAGKAVLTA